MLMGLLKIAALVAGGYMAYRSYKEDEKLEAVFYAVATLIVVAIL